MLIRSLTSIRLLLPKISFKSQSSNLFTNIHYFYHRQYLMDSKYDDRFVKIQSRAFHLYKQSILSSQFHQKKYLIVLIDCVRTKQNYQDFEQLVQFGIKNLNKFTQSLSIFSLATQLFLYNYPNKQNCLKVAKRGFEFFKQQQINKSLSYESQMKFSSFYIMKFLIFIQKNVGLNKISNEEFSLINFQIFKPLFLCFTIQMFYQNQLEKQYQIVNKLLEMFMASQKIIPFADLHHFRLAVKKVKNQQFQQFIDKVYNQFTIKSNQNVQQNQIKENQLKEIRQNSTIKNNNLSDNKIKQQKIDWNQMYRKALQRRNTITAFH